METKEYAALGGLITIIAAALALIIKQLEASRCTHIKCCGALFKVSQENAGLRKAMKSYEVRLAKDLARLSGQR